MRVFIDIGHPAHVHYFKNFIKIMEEKGHQFLISARDKECAHKLLDNLGLDYLNRYNGGGKIVSKIIYTLKTDLLLYKALRKFKPDITLSFSSAYLAHASSIINVPHIVFDDTEHAKLEHLLYKPFTDAILTPSNFKKDMGTKQLRFNGFMELCYLHPKYFKPNPEILKLLNVKDHEKYVIMRFIEWKASHDKNHTGLSRNIKLKAVKEFSKYSKVFISSEGKIDEELLPYQINIPPDRMHDALYFSNLFFGESGTMATEAAIMGVPTIRVSTISKLLGNFKELQDKYNLLFFYDSDEQGYNKALEIIKNKNSKKEWEKKRNKMILDKIDVTSLMVWFIENYPKSFTIIKNDPDYLNRFY